eukprot:CAMPEP_0119377206 /NCGR_PEP_ID=MMETSP1334-20130426/43710_1 /TAXON_ID=127549 /ORGANISM="Calcidiscus leptoporus, Strain RCC1130" /LENGTH=54 /DNA_ID=CAMNT_0007396033 /DNA_START=51 /DNA_END=215 /DNA_ORIENTATION=+
MSFWKFAIQQPLKPEVRPFAIGLLLSWVLLTRLSCGHPEETKAASKYLNPPKHH